MVTNLEYTAKQEKGIVGQDGLWGSKHKHKNGYEGEIEKKFPKINNLKSILQMD